MEDDDWFAPEPDRPQKPSISPKPIPKSQKSPTKDSEELDDDWFAEAPTQSPEPDKQTPPKFQLEDRPEDLVYPGTEDDSGDWFDKVSEEPAEYITVPSGNNAPRKESYMFGFFSKVYIRCWMLLN